MKSALIRDPDSGGWSRYRCPVEVVVAHDCGGVVDGLRRTERMVEESGLTAVGVIGYEAAPAFDQALRVHPPIDGLPLLCFGLFDRSDDVPTGFPDDCGRFSVGDWSVSQTEAEHRVSVGRIHDRIARGETYQVNHTFRIRMPFDGDPRSLFRALVRWQPESLAAYVDFGDVVICSASPELMFSLDGDRVVSRPMKGTAVRGHDPATDAEREQWLRSSEKNRAENAMIVDMVRNDLGRVAGAGTVEVTGRFDIERHPTVLQMTSTIEARTDAPVAEIVAALFPFASVTGAPKVRTMELIRDLEQEARGVYTGAIGLIRPGRQARFSVGIRTAVVDLARGEVEYGVGSAIVWDSNAAEEYRECLTKAKVLTAQPTDFELLETLLWEPEKGFSLLDRHLDRMAAAAKFFCRLFDRERILEGLRAVPDPQFRGCRSNRGTADQGPVPPLRVRLLVAADGSIRIETTPIVNDVPPAPVRLGLAVDPVARKDPFLHFKTTHREVYDRARASRPDCDDVLLWNERGEVTETTIANLVIRIDGEFVTPPVECGLLAGTLRAELLERGEIVERIVRVDDFAHAEARFLVNSVQGWRDVEWVDR
jgi:para-aminobenzoate synthetase/4-amino-4-deoxychorismate lyase